MGLWSFIVKMQIPNKTSAGKLNINCIWCENGIIDFKKSTFCAIN
jgi:hypothetical protein